MLAARAAFRDERCGDDADPGRGRIDARNRVGGALDVRLRGIDHLLQRLLGRRHGAAEAPEPGRQALLERGPVTAASLLTATAAAEPATLLTAAALTAAALRRRPDRRRPDRRRT